jgi:AraC-like DNA-binding protein
MKAWTFTTESWPLEARAAAWREAMHRLGLPVGDLAPGTAPRASATCLTSPLGMEFAVIEAGAQAISGRRADLPAAIWLALLAEGRARIESEAASEALEVGDIAYGPSGRTANLVLLTRCRIMFVRAPRVALGHRLIGLGDLSVGRLAADDGIAGVFSGLLTATARSLPRLTDDELRPVELALTEFLATTLAELDAGEGEGSAHLHRVSQIAETLLGEPDLSLGRLAAAAGVAPRTLQKLFADAGDTFSGYVRARRLERCRTDLASPLSASLSIADIGRRWGFRDPAYFSRAFRDAYGLSPREYRRALAVVSSPAWAAV